MRIIKIILVLFMVVIGAAFAVKNAQPVNLNYYLGVQEAPLALILVAALVLGALLGVLASLGAVVRLRHELGDLRRQQRQAQEEIENLRSQPVKE
ncbi:MAG: LapA family protein [Gammaproteobacteria bacterium]|nr:LapA family protein [Gammaproteobacteria bacterium]MBU1655696.1 LapA family protein [Gammaproteobacteria bacterium]MBU1961184.1 LapA family protein [Gammaproteobacteria bacterium]